VYTVYVCRRSGVIVEGGATRQGKYLNGSLDVNVDVDVENFGAIF
jgi:hypothetical protein